MMRLNDLINDMHILNIKIMLDNEDEDYDNSKIIFKGKATDFRPRFREFDKYRITSIWKSNEFNIDLDIFVREE